MLQIIHKEIVNQEIVKYRLNGNGKTDMIANYFTVPKHIGTVCFHKQTMENRS